MGGSKARLLAGAAKPRADAPVDLMQYLARAAQQPPATSAKPPRGKG
jgi:hypothetical protein